MVLLKESLQAATVLRNDLDGDGETTMDINTSIAYFIWDILLPQVTICVWLADFHGLLPITILCLIVVTSGPYGVEWDTISH